MFVVYMARAILMLRIKLLASFAIATLRITCFIAKDFECDLEGEGDRVTRKGKHGRAYVVLRMRKKQMHLPSLGERI